MKIWIITIFLFIGASISAQQDSLADYIRLNGSVSDFVSGDELDSFEIRVLLDAEIIYSRKYSNTQTYQIDLPYGFEYTIIYFSKRYASRKAMIDISDIPFVNKKVYHLNYDLGLVKKQKGIRTRDISKMYSGIARYSPTKDKVEWFPNQKERIDQIINNRITAANY